MIEHISKSTGVALGALAVAVVALLAACGGGDSSTASMAGQGQSGAVVQTRSGSGGQTMLVDADGKTLYVADQDSAKNIKCTGSCLGFWFPLTMKGGGAPSGDGVPAGKLGTVQRPDNGQTQVTFDGRPLYTFKLDTSAGMTKGDGFSDDFDGTTFDWHAATVTGASTSSPSPSSDNGGGYRY